MRRPGFSGTPPVACALLAAALLLAGAAQAQTPSAQPPSSSPSPSPSPSSAPSPSAQPPSAQESAPAAPAQASASPAATPPAAAAPESPHVESLRRGQALLAAGRHIEAAHALAAALRGSMSDPGAPQGLSLHIAGVLQQARSHIGVLYVAADTGKEILVDGYAIGPAPILGEVLLAPGKHRVIARGDICLGTADVDLAAGQAQRVKVPCRVAPTWRTPVLITGGIAAALAIGVGAATLAVSDANRDHVNRLAGEARTWGFVDPWMEQQAVEAERRRVDLLNASITSFLIGGGLLAAGTAVFFGVKRHRPAEPAPLVGATLGVGQAGLWMRW